jgi:hypothetical protein
MSHRIAVVGEAAGDFAVARELIDQSLLRCNRDRGIDIHYTYVGPSENVPFFSWAHFTAKKGKDYKQAMRGQFNETWPSGKFATQVFNAVHGFVNLNPDHIVIVKDTDNDDARRDTLRNLASLIETRYRHVTLGVVHTELECWLLAGFVPQDDRERERLAEVCRGEFPPGVGFNPCLESHKLTAGGRRAAGEGSENAKLNPKRVLRYLTDEDKPNDGDHLTPRSRACLHFNRHAILAARGSENGLADFLRDIEQRFIFGVFGVRVTTA